MSEYKKLTTFKEFYPFYLDEHSNPINKALHFIGTTLVLIALVYFLYTEQYKMIWLCPIVGYAFAWIGHFGFEKNRPATFKQPFFSFASDFVMWFHIITGKVKF